MSSAEVFCWGSLGPVGGEENPVVPVPIEEGRRGLVRKVYAGGGRALLARAEGVEWLPIQGGVRDSNGDIGGDDPRNLPGVESAAFGQDHTLVLRTTFSAGRERADGDAGGETKTEVLSWGSGEQGQLGLGAASLESKLPRAIPALSAYRVVQVACGAQHSAAVTSSGDLFTWGRGAEGQLGHASPHLPPELNDAITGVQLRPKPVPAFLARKKRQRPVAGVSCGANFTLVVTRAGEAWAFGGGAAGQLGIGRLTSTGVPKVVMPSCPATGQPFVEIAAGWAHALARTSGGRVYSWGFNALGSLGVGDHKTRFFPEGVPLGGGQLHTTDGEGSGDGLAGSELVGGDAANTAAAGVAVKVDACGNCSGALTAEGELFTWGCSNGGLGHRDGVECRGSQPGRTGHALRPRRVERLVGAIVSDFALSTQGGVALVPLRVRSIQPASGPLEAGCKVVIRGHGFWDSPDIVVKFTPVSKGHKPSASRSAVGAYIPRESRQGGVDLGDGTEFLTCMAPCFAYPEATYVEVSIDGTSFTADCTTFHYYRTPEVTRVTPDTCRPPFPRLRLDGEQFRPNEALMVRFEEEQQEKRYEGGGAGNDGGGSLLGGTGEDSAPLLFRSPPRIFTVPGRVESEVIETGTDPDTELPIHEERWFVTCDSPALLPEAKLPFVSRLTIAPNGADFNGEPLRFVAHDPHADRCLPAAVPVPVPVLVPVPVPTDPGDDGDGQPGGGEEPAGPCIRITGRNLYRGADLAVRLRFGLEDASVVPFRTVSFDAASESIVGVVPTGVEALVAAAVGAAPKEPEVPPATTVVVEVSMDGQEFFAVPDRLTVYRGPSLALHGDGVFPPTGGGWAELKPAESAYRGHEAKVRLVSEIHGFDVALPLLSSPPPQELEEGAETSAEAPCAEAGEGAPQPARPPSAGANKKAAPPVQAPAKDAEQTPSQEPCDGCDGASTEISDKSVWVEQEVPASQESFFFAVPPLSELAGLPRSPDGEDQGAASASGEESLRGKQQQAAPVPQTSGGSGGDGDGAEAAAPEEVKAAVSLLVSLNGKDWQPVSGPSLTYFQPPPEPVAEPEEEPKKGKGKKK